MHNRRDLMEGFSLIILIVLAVLFIVLATAKLKLHPFLSLLIAAFGVGIISGIPIAEVADVIEEGFGGLMGSIGLVIIFGTIIGVILERSGAALRMAELVVPVFCESGYIIFSSLKKALAKRAKVAVASLAVALATGLFATHNLVPPTPGPIAAAGNIGAESYLGTVILIGLIVSIPAVIAG